MCVLHFVRGRGYKRCTFTRTHFLSLSHTRSGGLIDSFYHTQCGGYIAHPLSSTMTNREEGTLTQTTSTPLTRKVEGSTLSHTHLLSLFQTQSVEGTLILILSHTKSGGHFHAHLAYP